MSITPIRVLLVEDDFGDADLLCELLELVPSMNFQVTQSRRLQEALEYLRQQHFDALLLDLSLPDSQGLATVSQIYTQAPNLPIVILSGLEDEAIATIAVQKGAQDYLVKGQVNSDLLARAIRYAIERAKNLQILNHREEQLQKANEDLERRVEERVTEIKQANITLRRLESQLRQALAQEKKLNNLKSRIITTVSHEYRTPLATILSSAELLEVFRHQWDEEKQLKHLHRIQSSVHQINALVDDVLLLNQVESAAIEFNPHSVHLGDFFTSCIVEQQAQLDDKHSLELVIDDDIGECFVDSQLIKQILTHLLSNAIKYSPNGGKIQVILQFSGDEGVEFQVCDQGMGIPLEEIEEIFDSFSRASNVGTIRGSGLGLAIVNKCLDLHNGDIKVESELGVGSTFTVTLPV